MELGSWAKIGQNQLLWRDGFQNSLKRKKVAKLDSKTEQGKPKQEPKSKSKPKQAQKRKKKALDPTASTSTNALNVSSIVEPAGFARVKKIKLIGDFEKNEKFFLEPNSTRLDFILERCEDTESSRKYGAKAIDGFQKDERDLEEDEPDIVESESDDKMSLSF